MKTLRMKLMVTAAAALGGLIVYDVSMRLGNAFYMIHERHPEMGLVGWLLFGLWGLSAAIVGMLSDRFWRERKLFVAGDVPFAIMFLYMIISALIYLSQTGW